MGSLVFDQEGYFIVLGRVLRSFQKVEEIIKGGEVLLVKVVRFVLSWFLEGLSEGFVKVRGFQVFGEVECRVSRVSQAGVW